jgi:hypothetical protein
VSAAGPGYDLLGYKRLIVDYHFSAFVTGTLANANAGDYVAACAALGVDSVLVYAKDHWGHCYYATSSEPRHPNVPQDLFGQVLAGLRQRGIVGYAYFSVGWDEHAVRSHPEWAMRDAWGEFIRRGAPEDDRVTGRWTYLCMNSPYRDVALRQLRAIVTDYDFPALFLDILFLNPARRVCHCADCQALWVAHGHADPLPTTYTPAYLSFAVATLGRFHQEAKTLIAAAGKSIRTTHNFGLPYDADDYVAMEINPLGRNYFRGSALAKIMRAEAGGREVELIGHRFNQDWDFTTKGSGLMRWEAATVLAHNCALMWVDQPHMDGSFDPQAAAAMRAGYAVVDDLAPHLRSATPYAEVALLYASNSVALNPDEELDFVGAYQLLTELHWPFDVIAERDLTVEALQHFRLLIVPHTRHLTAAASAAVAAYVHGGGALIFTHASAMLSPSGQPLVLPGFGLVQIAEPLSHPASFLKPAISLSSAHLRVTESLAFRPAGAAHSWATHVAPNIAVTRTEWVSHNVAPGADSGQPAVVSGASGQGSYVFCAPRLFAESVRQGLPALREFLTALLGHLYQPTLWVEVPAPVEATFSRQGDDLVICLVNSPVGKPALGGVMLLRDTPGYLAFDACLPIHDVRIHLHGRYVADARDGRDRPLTIAATANAATVLLARLDEYAVVRLAGFF